MGEKHLAGIRVQLLRDGTVIDLGPPPRQGDALVLDAPLGIWTVSTERPAFEPDDDVAPSEVSR